MYRFWLILVSLIVLMAWEVCAQTLSPTPPTRPQPPRAMAGSLVCLWAGDSRVVCDAFPARDTDLLRAGDGQTGGIARLLRRLIQDGSATNDLADLVYRDR